MSSVCRLLRRTFSHPVHPPASDHPISLIKERDLEILAEKFKKLCVKRTFRNKLNIYEPTVRRLASAGRLDLIEDILEDQKKYKNFSREGFAVRLMKLYGKSGMPAHAQKVFDEMPVRGNLSFNAIIGAYAHSEKFGQVIKLFNELQEKLSVKPDIFTYNTVVKALCEMGSLDSARSMLDEMETKRIEPNTVTYNTLLYAFYTNNRFEDGEMIWNLMKKKKNVAFSIRSYNAKLRGLLSEKRKQDAMNLVREMEDVGLKPDVFSFNSFIEASISEWNLEEAKQWYHEIKENGFHPDKVTFDMLLPYCLEVGDLGFAFELCEHIFDNWFSRRYSFDEALLQQVVDELVKSSKFEEARKLVQLGNANEYCEYKLKLPLESLC